MRVEVLEDMDVRKNGHRTWVAWEYSSTRPWTKLWKKCLKAKVSCWGKSTELKLVAKAWAHKKSSPTSFPNRLLESAWIKFVFPYAQLLHFKRGKQNTIGVKKEKMPSYHIIKILCQLIECKMQCYLDIML